MQSRSGLVGRRVTSSQEARQAAADGANLVILQVFALTALLSLAVVAEGVGICRAHIARQDSHGKQIAQASSTVLVPGTASKQMCTPLLGPNI